MRSYSILAIVLISCFCACQKEPDESLTPATCKLDKVYYYEDNDPVDTATYEFTGDQVSKVRFNDYDLELQYSGGRIVKRNYVLAGGGIAAYEDIIYNGDGNVARVDFFFVEPGFPNFLFVQYEFTYTGGKLSMLETRIDTALTGPVPIIRDYYMFTGNNVSQVIENDLINQAADTINYAYDANQNYYAKDPNRLLSDNLFSEFNGFLLPLAISANNVTTLSNNSGGASAVTYEENDKEEITALKIDGDLWARYLYKCQ